MNSATAFSIQRGIQTVIKLYGGSTAFLWGQSAVTTYDSGCLRSIVFKMLNADIRTQIDPKYEVLGAYHEDWWASELAKITNWQLWEIPAREEITEGVQWSGRTDFLTWDTVYETKGSYSKSAPYAIKKGEYKIGHLGQLASYFWQFDKHLGEIVFGAYKETTEGPKQTGHRRFKVEVLDDGRLKVDGRESPYFMQDLFAHVTTAADLLSRRKVHEYRPHNWEEKWKSPCGLCNFRELCDKYDAGQLDDETAITQAREYIK